MYSQYFIAEGRLEIFKEESIIAGIVAGFGFLGVFLSGAIVRHIWYEAFYVSHIVCFLLALVGGSMHQPDLTEKGLLIMLLLTASMWAADRLLRAARMLFRSVNNYAVVEPLPQGATKITLAKRPYGAVGGKHCFVWIPKIRMFESHPFTIAGTEPMEFVVNAYDGFTRDLHQYAVANPGARLRASVDGPYGTFPDPMASEFDKVVLIAGGSGATFTFGLANNMLERMGPNSTKNIVFIWAVKSHGEFDCSSPRFPCHQCAPIRSQHEFLSLSEGWNREHVRHPGSEDQYRQILRLVRPRAARIRHEPTMRPLGTYFSLHSISTQSLCRHLRCSTCFMHGLSAIYYLPTHLHTYTPAYLHTCLPTLGRHAVKPTSCSLRAQADISHVTQKISPGSPTTFRPSRRTRTHLR